MKLISLSGIFYELDGSIWVESHSEHHCLSEALAPFEGKKVQVVLHHEHDPDNMLSWGAGSCCWEPTGTCPFGHHQQPARLLHFDESGLLQDNFHLKTPDGVIKSVPLWATLGHKTQIVVLDLEKESYDKEDIGPLWDRATDLMSQLDRIQSLLNEET